MRTILIFSGKEPYWLPDFDPPKSGRYGTPATKVEITSMGARMPIWPDALILIDGVPYGRLICTYLDRMDEAINIEDKP